MLNDARPDRFSRIYIRPGKTDCRMGIAGLSTLVRYQLQLNPFQRNVLFLFCGSKHNMIKALVWEGDGFLLMTKRLSNGRFQWPRNQQEVMALSYEQFHRLMQGFTVEGSIREATPKHTG